MSRIRERHWDAIAPPEEGELDGFLLLAQAGILAKLGRAVDLPAGLAAITGAGPGTAGSHARQPRRAGGSDDAG